MADEGEVRDPRLPPARLLLRARHADDACSASLLGIVVARLADLLRQRDHDADDRARRAAPDLRARSSRCSRCGSTRSRTRTCAEDSRSCGALRRRQRASAGTESRLGRMSMPDASPVSATKADDRWAACWPAIVTGLVAFRVLLPLAALAAAGASLPLSATVRLRPSQRRRERVLRSDHEPVRRVPVGPARLGRSRCRRSAARVHPRRRRPAATRAWLGRGPRARPGALARRDVGRAATPSRPVPR